MYVFMHVWKHAWKKASNWQASSNVGKVSNADSASIVCNVRVVRAYVCNMHVCILYYTILYYTREDT